MDTSLIQRVKQEYGQDVLSALTDHLGENPGNLNLAINSAIPALFAALLKKNYASGQTGLSNMISASETILGGHDQIGEKLKSVFSSQADPNGVHSMEQSGGMLENVFGDRLHSIAAAISSFSGVKPSSAHQLLAGVSVASMAVIAQLKNSRALADQDVLNLLSTQKDDIIERVPTGLNLAAALGIDHLSDIDNKPTVPHHDLIAADKIAPGKNGKWLVLLIILVLLAALWWFWRKYDERQQDNYKPGRITQAIGEAEI